MLRGRILKRIRNKARFDKLTREAFVAADGDVDLAKVWLEEQAKERYGIDPATILFLVKLAYEIWKWWKSMDLEGPDAEWAEIPSEMFEIISDDQLANMGAT